MDSRSLASAAIDLFKAFCITVIVIATAFTFYLVGPAVETRYFPVVGKLSIDRMEWRGPTVTRIWASFNKRRDCEYVGIAWFRGTRDNFERVPVILHRDANDRSSPNRPVGYQHAGPWDVAIPMHELRINSFSILSHACHPFWMTRTEFYP